MAFGWFSKKGSTGGKALQRAKKLADQGRWAEALTYYQEALEGDGSPEEATQGARTCCEQLVEHNLAEAQTYFRASDPQKAREHADLALQLATGQQDLIEKAENVIGTLFGPTQGGPTAGPDFVARPADSEAKPVTFAESEETDPGELFEFYLESLSTAEREVFEPLGDDFKRGFVLLQEGHTELARPLLEAAADQAPGSAGVPYAQALLASLEGANDEAEACFARALELSPDFGPAAHHRAGVLREEGKTAEAAAFLDRWGASHPEDGEAWVLLAACRMDNGDPSGALAAAETAEKWVSAADPSPALIKAQIFRQRGEREKARETLQAVAARRPDSLDALVPLGQILIETGGSSAERAAELFKHCYRLDPERGWWYLVRVAEAYVTRGWQAEARDVLETAAGELPDAADARAEWDKVNRMATG